MSPADIDYERLGKEIRRARTAAGLNQRQAADAIGISNRTLSDLENGRTGHPSKLRRALDYFGIDPTGAPQAVTSTGTVAGDLVRTWVDAAPSQTERQHRSDHIVRTVANYQSDHLRRHIDPDDLAVMDADLAANPPQTPDTRPTGQHRRFAE